jgi:RNA 3'-terminal phosphate cyclase (ATP)
MLEIDGSHGEGGGQVLRTSLALSLITRRPFHLKNVRARRSKPGLQPQHLMSVQAAATIGQAKLRGATLHSTDLVFEPGETVPGNYHFRIGTAGATGLVLHTVYLPLALLDAPSTVTIEGGTHVRASPCFHFLQTTWAAYMALLGINIKLNMRRPGFYPRGGGLLEARIEGNAGLRGLDLPDLGQVKEASVLSAVAGLPEKIAQRQADRAQDRLEKLGLQVAVRQEVWQGGPGTMLAVELPTAPVPTLFFGLGERGKPAERVADEAVKVAQSFLDSEPLAVDGHSADQLLMPACVAHLPSQYRVADVTRHLLTNVMVIRSFLDVEMSCDAPEGREGWLKVLR